jgi:hypothetical protein
MNLPLSHYVGLTLTEDQLKMVDLIESEFVKANLSRYWAAAAVTNALKESVLNPTKVFYGQNYSKTKKKTEDSVGLFMLNSMGRGLGTGMPKGSQYPDGDSRKDPTLNIQRVIREIKNLKAARTAFTAAGEDIPELAALFAQYIEKPDDIEKSKAERKEIAAAMFPKGIVEIVDVSQKEEVSNVPALATSTEVEPTSAVDMVLKLALGVCAAGIIFTLVLRQRAIQKKELKGFKWPS